MLSKETKPKEFVINDAADNLEIVNEILNKEKERILNLNKKIQPARSEGVSEETLNALKDAATIPQMADSNDKKELEMAIDKELELLEEKKTNLNKMLTELEEKLKKKGNMPGFSEFWK